MIRLLLPSLLGFAFFLTALWLGYFLLKRYIKSEDEQTKAITKSIAWIITILVSAFFAFYIINIASVNEIPRNEIDRSAQTEGIRNFEDRMIKDASKIDTREAIRVVLSKYTIDEIRKNYDKINSEIKSIDPSAQLDTTELKNKSISNQ